MRIRCNLNQGDSFMELDCRSFHTVPEHPDVFCFMLPSWDATYNESASRILGSVLCHLEADGSRPLLSAHAAVSSLVSVRIIKEEI